MRRYEVINPDGQTISNKGPHKKKADALNEYQTWKESLELGYFPNRRGRKIEADHLDNACFLMVYSHRKEPEKVIRIAELKN